VKITRLLPGARTRRLTRWLLLGAWAAASGCQSAPKQPDALTAANPAPKDSIVQASLTEKDKKEESAEKSSPWSDWDLFHWHTPHREQATQHMFDIANYWLDDTRQEMRETREKQEGKRWYVPPHFLSFERSKPLLDREGRAIEKLEQVRYHDINGPLADKALFMSGSVKFFDEDYKEAAFLFSQIAERHPRSDLAPKAIELAIICKNLSTGGSD